VGARTDTTNRTALLPPTRQDAPQDAAKTPNRAAVASAIVPAVPPGVRLDDDSPSPVKTGSGVVFAADGKTTTQGVVGLEQDGSPTWVEQTYDNATKVVADRTGTMMATARPT